MKNPFRRKPVTVTIEMVGDDALLAAIRRSIRTATPTVWTCGQLGLCGDPDEAA